MNRGGWLAWSCRSALVGLAVLCGVLPIPDARADGAPALPHAAGEFDAQSAVVIGAPFMLQHEPQVLVELVSALSGHVRVFLLSGPAPELTDLHQLLHAHGISPYSVEYLLLPVDTSWARDYGPVFRSDSDGVAVLDPLYGHLQTHERPQDDDVARLLANWLQLELQPVPLHLEGGNILSNGQGLVISTTSVIEQNAGAGGLAPKRIESIVRKSFAAERWAYVPPMAGEPTAHIDMFCAFTAASDLVVGRMDASTDPVNAARLDEAARQLGEIATSSGPMRVHRVDMPSPRDGVFYSYTNVVIANSVVVVPIYPDVSPKLDQKALALYARLFPERKIVGVDATGLAERRGALRCVSFHIPGYVDIPE